VTATATKADGDGDSVQLTYVWKLNGATVKTTSSTGALTDTLDLSQAGNGDHGDSLTVTVTPNDGIENGAAAADSLTVANSAPTIAASTPAAGAAVTTRTPTLAASYADLDGDTGTVTFRVCSDAACASALGTFDATPSAGSASASVTSGLFAADGDYWWQASAVDSVGATTAWTAPRKLVVDTANPTVGFTAPSDGAFIKAATATVSATAADAGTGVTSVEFFECTATGTGCPSASWSSIGVRTSAPYSLSWTLPGDGVRALKVVATDGVANTASRTIELTLDQTPPTGTLADPGAYLRGTVTLHASAADATSGVNSLDFSFSGATSGAFAADGGTTYDGTWNTTGVADGSYDLNIFVTDRATNTFTPAAPRTVLVDNTPPAASVDDPGAFRSGTIPLTVTASDSGSGLDTSKTTFERSPSGADTWTAISSPATWTPADGSWDVSVKVEDRAGNKTTSAIRTLLVDNTPPATTEDADAAWHRTDVVVHLSATDAESGVQGTEYKVDSGSWQSGTTVTVPAPSDGSNDGTHTITYRSTNRAGVAESDRTATVKIDATAPSAALDNPGANAIVRGAIDLTSTVSDPTSGVASIIYRIAPAGTAEAAPCDTWGTQVAAHFDTTSVADGLYDLRVVAVDNAANGRCSTFVQNVRVDNTAPNTVDDAPSAPQNHDVTVHLLPGDAGSGVASTSYRLNGGAWQTGTNVVVTAAGHEGPNTIDYTSTDVAGNVEPTRSADVVIDTTAPSGSGAGDPGSILSGDAHLTASPSDGDVASIEFAYRADGASGPYAPIDSDTSAPYDVVWHTNSVADGLYDLQMTVVDTAGNSTVTPLSQKRVDNTPPDSAAVTSPAAAAVRSGDVLIVASATDAGAGVAAVSFQVKPTGAADFSTVDTDTAAPWSTSWNSRSVPDGPVELRAVVTDRAGNTPLTSAVRTITIDNNAPTVSVTAPSVAAGTVTVSATGAADVASVVFERSPAGANTWTALGTTSSAPFSVSWTTGADGLYDVRATATDVGGNTGTDVKTVRVDNTAPTAALTAPAAGATVGGPSIALAATAADAGAGVSGVTFQFRAAGSAGAWTDVAGDAGAPYGATWNATGVPSGDYDLRAVAADGAGNTAASAAARVTVDSTAPTGSFSGLPASLSGTVTLTVWTAGGASRVTFEERPVGGTTWTQIAADTTAPYAIDFDTRLVADGRYDLRATTSDAFGNSSTDVRTGLLVDNTAPSVVSSTPADGSVVASADKIALTATEDLSDVTDVQLDGVPLAAPVVNGANATFATGALPVGLHTLGGRLVDFGGQSRSFQINVTVWTVGAGEAPPVARSTTADAPIVLTTPDAMATVTFPAGAYSGGADQFLVLRLDMGTPVSLVPAGLIPGARVIDIRAVWASDGSELHEFLVPLQISMVDPSGGSAIAATYEGGRWRMIPEIPGGTTLPGGWRDGFYRDTAGVHVLTTHLTLFTLMRDIEAPPPPADFAGVVADDGLTLRWAPGRDNSGFLRQFTLFVDGQAYANYELSQHEAKMGAFGADDTREFSIVETDLAGNVSPPAGPLLAVPTVAGKTLADAKAALAARGFAVGKVTEVVASAPAGTVVAPAGVQLRLKGAVVDLQVAVQTVPRNAQFVFQVSRPKHTRVAPTRIVSQIRTAKPARITATLYGPNRLRFVQRWSFSVKAGTTTKSLRLRRPTVHGGVYELVWVARTASAETLRYRQRVRIYAPPATRRALTKR
jgi:hypothetical protein